MSTAALNASCSTTSSKSRASSFYIVRISIQLPACHPRLSPHAPMLKSNEEGMQITSFDIIGRSSNFILADLASLMSAIDEQRDRHGLLEITS